MYMNKLIIICLAFVLQSIMLDGSIYKSYVGGRSFYTSVDLDLRTDSSYFLSEWYHNEGFTYDSGSWRQMDSLLILNSFAPKYNRTKVRLSRRQKRKLKTNDDYFLRKDTVYRFQNDTFLLRDSLLFLFDFKELNDRFDSSFYFSYLTLKEKNSN